MVSGLINENPIVYEKSERRVRTESSNTDELSREAIDQLEVFDILFFFFSIALTQFLVLIYLISHRYVFF